MNKNKIENLKKVNIEVALDERKKLILLTIIKIYLDTGEPVGSRTISKKLEPNLSSATIRNEMSDLEEMGYIIKPHTSAGRIPSDKGYRYYVNNLIVEKNDEIKNLKAEMTARVDKLEDMLKTVVKTIASNTNYAAMIEGPKNTSYKIKYVQLSKLEEEKVLVVIVAEGNVVKTTIMEINSSPSAKDLIDVSMCVNNLLSGIKIMDLASNLLNEKIENLKKYKSEMRDIVNAIKIAFEDGDPEKNIFTYGSNNFFKYKEFTENENAGNLVETFEQKKDLVKLIEKSHTENDNGLSVYIGNESNVKAMKDCSVITANCDFGNGIKGTIGVVGPKRMDYEKVLKTIKNTMQNLNNELSK